MKNLAERFNMNTTESGESASAVEAVATDMPPVTRVLQYLRESVDGVTKADGEQVFDMLAVALAVERLDPILMRIRGRTQVVQLLSQLARSTYLITHLAEMMKVEYDGSPVEADENFGSWDEQRLTRLVALITAEASNLKYRSDEARELLRAAVAKSEADAATIKKLTDDINRERGEADERVRLHSENCIRYTTMLAAYNDLQRFVVARIDPTTGKIGAYLRVEKDGSMQGVPTFNKATRFEDFADANDLRVEAIRLRRAKVDRSQRAAVSAQYVVMQLALRAVDLQTVIDETPDEEDED